MSAVGRFRIDARIRGLLIDNSSRSDIIRKKFGGIRTFED